MFLSQPKPRSILAVLHRRLSCRRGEACLSAGVNALREALPAQPLALFRLGVPVAPGEDGPAAQLPPEAAYPATPSTPDLREFDLGEVAVVYLGSNHT